MNLSRIPATFFPTTSLLIDDNQRFLKNISLRLDEHLAYKLFDNTEKALQYLNSVPKAIPSLSKYVASNVEQNSYLSNQYSINLDLSSIHKEIYNKERFKNISVIVIDYAMPNMNGIQFCQQLSDNQLKKIMLTGEADHQIAVQAFNDRVIDKFILKSESHLNQKLNKTIYEMQQKYFLELTEGIENSLANESTYCLRDPKVIEVFNDVCKEHNIIEYYLLDASGSFLLLDILGNPSWFIIRNDAELKMYADFAEDDKVSPTLCAQLKSGQKIPFFPKMKIEGANWESHLYPAKKIQGKESYYYAWLKEVKDTNLSLNKIFSYKEYLNLSG